MSIADAFAGIALAFSDAGLGPYHDAEARWPGVPVYDDGGSIVTPGAPIAKPCSCQVDAVTEAMRSDTNYRDKDVRLLILTATLDGALDTDATIHLLAGPYSGTAWSVQTVGGDPMAAYHECRGRPA